MGLRAVSPDSRDMNAGRKRLARWRAKSALTSGKLPASGTLVTCGPGNHIDLHAEAVWSLLDVTLSFG